MQRIAGLLALTLTAALLVGCAYDPYTGTYAPCCGYYGNPYYGNPYYRYPPPYAPYGYPSGPYMAQPPSQPGAYASPPSDCSPRHMRHRSRASRGIRITTDTVATRPMRHRSRASRDTHRHPANRQPSRMRRPLPRAALRPGFAAISATRMDALTRDQRWPACRWSARSFGSM